MKSFRHLFFAVVRAGIGIGLVIYLGISGAINWRALLGLLAAWPITLVALALLFVDVALMAWRLSVLFRPHGFRLSFNSSLRLTFIGIFFNSFLPGATGGDVVKVLYAAEGNRGRRTEVATLILLDRALGMLALLILPLLIAPFFLSFVASKPILHGLLRTAGLLALVGVAGLLFSFSSRVRHSWFFTWVFRKLPGGRYLEAIFDTVHAYGRRPGTLVGVVVIAIVTHLLATGITLLAVQATNPRGLAWEMCVLIPLGHLANSLPLTPGGLGVGEAAFDALFGMARHEGGAEALLGWRLLNLLMSLPGLLFYLQGRRRFVHHGEPAPTLDPET